MLRDFLSCSGRLIAFRLQLFLVVFAILGFQEARADRMLVANPKAGEIDAVSPGGALTPVVTGLSNPTLIATTPDNTIYVANVRYFAFGGQSETVLRITPSGQTTTVITASDGAFSMAVDRQGDLFVVNNPNMIFGAVAAQSSTASPTPVAPVGLSEITPDGTLKTILSLSSQLPLIGAVATDDQGNAFVGLLNGIDKVSPDGVVTLFQSIPNNPYFFSLAVDHDGNVYGTNGSQQVGKITPQGAISIVGTGAGLAADSQGNIFSAHNSISQINSDGTTSLYATTTFALSMAFLVPEPSSMALAAIGLVGLAAWGWRRKRSGIAALVLLVLLLALGSEARADRMLIANPQAGEIDVVASGGATTPYVTGFGGPLVGSPFLVATAPDTTLFVLTSRRITNANITTVTKVSPSGQASPIVVGINGMAVDSKGDLFVSADGSNTTTGGTHPPLAPFGVSEITPDGTLRVVLPLGVGDPSVYALATDSHDNVYVGLGDKIAKISPAGDVTVVKLFLADPVISQALEGLPPFQLAVDRSGDVYMTGLNMTIVKITPAGIATSLGPGFGLGVDSHGDVFTALNTISEINSDGTLSTYGVTSFARSVAFLVPEPSSIALAALGLVGLAASGWRRKRSRLAAMAIVAVLVTFAAEARAVTIAWSPVGNPGNAADTAFPGFSGGAVAYNYSIGTYDVAYYQYAEFLNAKDPTGANALGLYHAEMDNAAVGGISYNASNSNGNKYTVLANLAKHPVNYVTWYDAVRFANWMNNGQGNGDTETGSYTLLHDGSPAPTAIPSNALSIARSPDARIVLPSEDEWDKAAYFNSTTNSYFLYPTSSNTSPIASSPTGLTNHANFAFQAGSTVTDVGAYTGTTSPSGAFDMAGNVAQWIESLHNGSQRSIRGSTYSSGDASRSESAQISYDDPALSADNLGFRLAMVPEPSSVILAGLGLGALVAWAWRRKRA